LVSFMVLWYIFPVLVCLPMYISVHKVLSLLKTWIQRQSQSHVADIALKINTYIAISFILCPFRNIFLSCLHIKYVEVNVLRFFIIWSLKIVFFLCGRGPRWLRLSIQEKVQKFAKQFFIGFTYRLKRNAHMQLQLHSH
jgi:hypothetical protein